jgi:hypothetical protein
VRQVSDHSGGVLDDASLPQPYVPEPDPIAAELTRVRREWRDTLAEDQKPSAYQLEMHERDEAKAKQERDGRTAQGIRVYGEARAELVSRPGEDYVRQPEQDLYIDGKPWGRTWTGGTPDRV